MDEKKPTRVLLVGDAHANDTESMARVANQLEKHYEVIDVVQDEIVLQEVDVIDTTCEELDSADSEKKPKRVLIVGDGHAGMHNMPKLQEALKKLTDEGYEILYTDMEGSPDLSDYELVVDAAAEGADTTALQLLDTGDILDAEHIPPPSTDERARSMHSAAAMMSMLAMATMGGFGTWPLGHTHRHFRSREKPTKVCTLPGCDELTTHNGGYCCAEHCLHHQQLRKDERKALKDV